MGLHPYNSENSDSKKKDEQFLILNQITFRRFAERSFLAFWLFRAANRSDRMPRRAEALAVMLSERSP